MQRLPLTTAAIVLAIAAAAHADPVAGKRLAQQWCADCHQIEETGLSPNTKAPPFRALAAQAWITETSLHAFLRTPHSTMPNLIVKGDDAEDIISYILSLKPAR